MFSRHRYTDDCIRPDNPASLQSKPQTSPYEVSYHLAALFPLRLLVMSFSSSGQNPFDFAVNLPEAGFVSTFCLHIGHTFLLASMWREEWRHSEQKRCPVGMLISNSLWRSVYRRKGKTYHSA